MKRITRREWAVSWNTNILDFQISQGSVATQLRWGGSLYNGSIENFLRNLTVKELWKSVFICRSYDPKKNKVAVFFGTRCTINIGRIIYVRRWTMMSVLTKIDSISAQHRVTDNIRWHSVQFVGWKCCLYSVNYYFILHWSRSSISDDETKVFDWCRVEIDYSKQYIISAICQRYMRNQIDYRDHTLARTRSSTKPVCNKKWTYI